MDFKHIQRVVLWGAPRTFSSLVQKIGRTGRDFTQLGEAIVYVTTKAMVMYSDEVEMLGGDVIPEDEEEDRSVDGGNHVDRDLLLAEDPELEQSDEDEDVPAPKPCGRVRPKQHKNRLEALDHEYLMRFIATNGCRWLPWNTFFDNDTKGNYLSISLLSSL